ncbi:TlpA disulfide reductase family protein [Pedobacter borealis]|uniref:TlpA disulfide reductase family protein n=1 Tax=Pedobacter borealis TaxID=475254 RepID=UPI00068F95B3|nr:TlpA disulfide reductase family protein [Pedobacter borealis]
MKGKLMIALFVLASTLVQGQTAQLFQINGSLVGMSDVNKVFLRYNSQGRQITDTAEVSDNGYSFTGTIDEPQAFIIWIEYKPTSQRRRSATDQADLFLTNGMVNITTSNLFSNMNVTGDGSVWNKDYNVLLKEWKTSKDSTEYWAEQFLKYSGRATRYEKAVKLNQAPPYSHDSYMRDSATMEYIDNKAYPGQAQRLRDSVLIPYIRKNPNSPVSLFALRIVSDVIANKVIKEYKLTQSLFDLLLPEIKNYNSGKNFSEILAKAAKTAEGTQAPEITLPDVNGKPFSLSSLKGKYVLVHFWASWCGPCRGANPSLKKIYEKYKAKGFEILAISVDEKEADWLKAVGEDKMPWLQVRDNKFDISRLYQIGSIPRNFLIAADGTIITRTLEDNTLEAKLQTLLGK